MTDPANDNRYFHGGVPGLAVGDVLVPASELGISVQYFSPYAVHDPAWVYVTTDEAVAAAYASRYQLLGGRPVPGDVYQVQPVGTLRENPDYGGHFPGTFLPAAAPASFAASPKRWH
ncbi:hypothetical protein ILP97_17295 [Amycolatopsis sp. H6(2020)]|nr:hypothetical protein [Amycolatopsis sp. H6(2020)]